MTSNSNVAAHAASAQPPRRGDVRSIEGLLGLQAEPQLALIIRAPDSGHDYAEIMLVHERVEMATLDDIVLNPDSERFPNGLVVQKLLRGAVWNLQLSTFLSRLTPEHMAEVVGAILPEGSVVAGSTTDPSPTNESDRSKEFYESQLQALWDITGDCTDAMLDDDILPWRVDTGLLSRDLLSNHPNPEFIITEVMHILHTRAITATLDDSQDLAEYGSLQPSTWSGTEFGSSLASQIATGARQVVDCSFRDAAYYTDQLNRGVEVFCVPHRIPAARALTIIPPTRLVTAPFLWADDGHALLNHLDANGHIYPLMDVMMLATPGVSVDTVKETSHGD